MSAKIIKLGIKDDLASLIKQIKSIKDQEVVLEVEKGSRILTNPEAMRLIKKTADVLGKKLKVQVEEDTGIKVVKPVLKSPRSDVKSSGFDSSRRGGKLSDIKVNRAGKPAMNPKIAAAVPVARSTATEDGFRLEIEMDRSSTSKISKIVILSLIVLVFAVFGLAVLLPKADITVFARSEPITRDFEITVDKAVASANRASMQIPGIPVSKEVSQTKSFPTTGVSVTGTKTGGTVTIYNNTPNILKFNVATTTLIANGKNYVLVNDITGIRPNGAANTGIAIAATEAGTEYNLPANTRFQIVNAALGAADVYAENPQALGGGTTGAQTKILSQQDLDNATNSLTADIISQAESDLTVSSGTNMRLLDSAVKKEILAKTANKDVGAAVDNFSMTMIAKVTGLAFREDDVATVVVSKINEVLSNDKYLLDDQKQQYTANFKSIDLTADRGVMDVHFETTAAYKVDAENLPKILAGKNESEIKEILLSKPEIDDVTVKFWPEWFVHKAPKFNGKINIETVLSQ